ncbi:hypothetical protein PM082_024975 [Marasmius tenuissimus]|nr:hypothetical protein PM082_024975 [Marasmius tenuissimus]
MGVHPATVTNRRYQQSFNLPILRVMVVFIRLFGRVSTGLAPSNTFSPFDFGCLPCLPITTSVLDLSHFPRSAGSLMIFASLPLTLSSLGRCSFPSHHPSDAEILHAALIPLPTTLKRMTPAFR